MTLAAGTVPVLLKVYNTRADWGFIFRITDQAGDPLKGLEYRIEP